MANIDEKSEDPLEGLIEEQNQKLHIPGKLPVLLLRDIVIFPYMIAPLFVGREKSKAAIDQSLAGNRMILLLTQKDMSVEEPKREDVYEMGTVALIMRMLKLPDGRVRILAQGLIRARIESYEEEGAYVTAGISVVHEPDKPEKIARGRGPHPQRPLRPGEGHLARQEHPARGPHHRRQRRRAGPAGRPDGQQPRAQGRGSPGDPGDRRPRPASQEGLRAPGPRARAPRRPVEDLDRGQGRDGQAPEAVLPPPADEGHPEGARRGDGDPGGDQGLPGQAEGAQGPRRGPRGAREADRPPGPDAPRVGRDVGRPQLPRLDVRPALEQDDRRQPRPRQSPARSSTRTTTA